MSAELTEVDQWIYARLHTDGELGDLVGERIYSEAAPQGTTGRLIIFGYLGGADRMQSSIRVSYFLYLIRAVAESASFTAVKRAAERIDAVMSIPMEGIDLDTVQIFSVVRDQAHKRFDQENGIPVVYLGGIYRIRTQPLV